MATGSLVKLDFEGAAKLVEAAAQIVKTFTEALRDALKAGAEAVDLVSARKAERRLKSMYLRAVHLSSSQSIMLLPAAEKYVSVPTAENWQVARTEMEATLREVKPLIAELSEHRSNFVFDQTYISLLDTMRYREVALQKVLNIPAPPTSPEDLDLFREFLKKYVILVRDLQHLNLAVAAYLRGR